MVYKINSAEFSVEENFSYTTPFLYVELGCALSLDDQGWKTRILVSKQTVVNKEVILQSIDAFTRKYQTANIMMRRSDKKSITLSTEQLL